MALTFSTANSKRRSEASRLTEIPVKLRGHATRRTSAQKYAPPKYPFHPLSGIKKTLHTQWKGKSLDDKHVCERHKLKPNIRLVKSHQLSAALKGSFNLRVCVSDVLSLLFPVDEHQNCLTRHSYPPRPPQNLSPDALPACLCFLPPRPKLPPPFGLPKPPLAGRLVEGQESASQGRPGSPAFSSPGRL